MEEEKMRLESEKGTLQRDKASLETKLKQAVEHSQLCVACVCLLLCLQAESG